MAIISR